MPSFGIMTAPMQVDYHDILQVWQEADAIPEIEDRLFQLNIHEQSLFPDMEGLSGLIRQRVRLHWT